MNTNFIPVSIISAVVDRFNPNRNEAHFSNRASNIHIFSGTRVGESWVLKVEHVVFGAGTLTVQDNVRIMRFEMEEK